ncbi:Diadenosine tetraphosphate (Ap4A) hydrolase [Burkholderiales bacterium 8X]|nr:Diadenosine tetraphosphate (Ap4A) hydrolase [Burkholderiales bacterium 8X]
MSETSACPLCTGGGGRLVFASKLFRVIHAEEAGFPAFYRVVWNAHVAEWSDLSAEERALCMEAVAEVERAMRETLSPTKVNLAALGNVVPHLHWHVIGRFEDDSHFPAPIWAAPLRARNLDREAVSKQSLAALEAELVQRLRARSL